ncbi:MAG TPA: cytochrome c [Persephonella sp.]|nr:cytochrome c [Hydrogenothermaceae bacterium]HIQ25108.1 cytochrome c [Persephonella sp.]
MKKLKLLILGTSFFATTCLAVDGFEVHKKYCSSCHLSEITMEKLQKIESMVKAGKKPPIKAPPFPEVSARIKYFYPSKEDFIKFVVDYITNPSAEKAKCLPMALQKFGVMPPIGKVMTDEEKLAVANWLYDNYNTKWEDLPVGKKGQGQCKHKHNHEHMHKHMHEHRGE